MIKWNLTAPLVGLMMALAFTLAAGPADAAPALVRFSAPHNLSRHSIYISLRERALYFVTGSQDAIRYPVAVGRRGKEWTGKAYITGKYLSPAWSPPDEVRRDNPSLPDVIPAGSPHNPMGAAALTLSLDEYAIHGTTLKMRQSIGTAASYGCIRMYNEDVLDLFQRVEVGTLVVVGI